MAFCFEILSAESSSEILISLAFRYFTEERKSLMKSVYLVKER